MKQNNILEKQSENFSINNRLPVTNSTDTTRSNLTTYSKFIEQHGPKKIETFGI
jgi:hypothetical protein